MALYCLDSNILIVPWNSYYSPDFCGPFWETITSLGQAGKLFIPAVVRDEIDEQDDELAEWLRARPFLVRETTARVGQCLRQLYNHDPSHVSLVDAKRGRSRADPWVIAHAMAHNATVVTKEKKETNPNSTVIRIPNVCANLKRVLGFVTAT